MAMGPEVTHASSPKADADHLALMRLTRPALVASVIFSVFANLLLLVSPIYMLQIYDRVVTSGSLDALLWLTVIALFLLAVYGAAEAGRRRTLAMAGTELEHALAPRIFAAFESKAGLGFELDRDLRHLRLVKSQFEYGGLLPWIDLPFTPLFLAILFFVHPMLGAYGVAGVAVVAGVAFAAEWTARRSGELSSSMDSELSEYTAGLSRQRSALVAMGLVPASLGRWKAKRMAADGFAEASGRANNSFAAAARAIRLGLQVGVLAAGATLALSQQISLGSIVACSIILARALAPLDQIVGGWRQTAQAYRSLKALRVRIEGHGTAEPQTALPRPEAELRLDRLSVAAPGTDQPLIRPFSFAADGGDVVAVLGANGCGKTCLLQTLAGAWPVLDGRVLLGGRAVHDWPSADRGRFVGYVPQDVEIFPGTVKDNVARLSDGSDDALFLATARAGAHELVLSLPEGYDTPVGPGGRHLSAGQRQLLGLARALYGDPVLLLLDEPTANLDNDAAQRLLATLDAVAQSGTVVVAATHDMRLAQRSKVSLAIRQGAVMAVDMKKHAETASERNGFRQEKNV